MHKQWRLLLVLSAAVSGAVLRADQERRFERSFSEPGEVVVLNVPRGMIEVSEVAADGELTFEVVLRSPDAGKREGLARLAPDLLAPFKRDTEEALRGLEPRYKAGAKRVEMTVRDGRPIVIDSDPSLQATINVRVRVPAGRRLEVRTVTAGVSIEDYTGTVDLRGETGSYFLRSVRGDIEARTTSGSITVAEVHGRADLRTASGNLFAGHLRGPARLATSNGAVEVLQAHDAISIRGDDCDIVLGLAQPVPRDIDLVTSAGTITLNIDQNLPLTVDATTRLLGKVRTRGLDPLVRRGAFNASSLLADFNGGGETVRLRTKWGNIVLVGREPLGG